MIVVGVAAPSILDAADGELVLRICGSARHGQLVRLRSPKCTIGSGPRCTLRLRARNVRPLHCLILRGASETVIRRLSPDTRLNGRAFTDARLAPGDHLGVGPIEFEVVEAGQVPDPRAVHPLPTCQPQPRDTSADLRKPDGPRARLGSADRHGRATARRLVHELRAARARIAELENEREADAPGDPRQPHDLGQQEELLDRRQDELDGLAAKLAQQGEVLRQKEDDLSRRKLALDEKQQALQEESEQIDRTRADLESERRALDEQHSRWAADGAADQPDLSRQAQELEARLAELDAGCREIEQQREQWSACQANAEQEFQERSREIEAQLERVDALQAELDARRAELEAREAELDARESEIDRKHQQWESDRVASDTGHREPPEEVGQEDDLRFEQPSRQAPGSSAEVLRRLGLAPAFSDEDEDGAQPTDSAEQTRNGAVQPPDEKGQEDDLRFEPSPQSPGSNADVLRQLGLAPTFSEEDKEEEEEEEEDRPTAFAEPTRNSAVQPPDARHASGENQDESIDDYMSRLLERVRATTGRSSEATVARISPPTSAVPPAPQPTRAPVVASTDAPPRPPAPAPEPRELAAVSPRAVAPEKSLDLSAMRDLANLSAQAAIHRHTQHVMGIVAATRLTIAVVGLTGGAFLSWIWWTKSQSDWILYPAMASFVIGLFWGARYVMLKGFLLLAKPGRLNRNRKAKR